MCKEKEIAVDDEGASQSIAERPPRPPKRATVTQARDLIAVTLAFLSCPTPVLPFLSASPLAIFCF